MKLFREAKKVVVTATGVNHEFIYKFHQGMTKARVNHNGAEHAVEFKAFRLIVEERISYENEVIKTKEHDYGFICARSTEVAYALARLPKQETLDDVELFLIELMEDSEVAMKRDTKKALYKLLGYRPTQTSDYVKRTNKEYKPIPQIKLPWMSE